MRLHKTLLETFTLLSVLFLFSIAMIGGLGYFFPLSFKVDLNERFFLILGVIALFLAIFMTYFFIAVHKKNLLAVRFSVKPIDVDQAIIKDYLEKALRKLNLSVTQLKVEIENQQKLHVFVEQTDLPKLEELETIEKNLGGILGSKLGYLKDFQVYFSAKTGNKP